MAVVHSESLRGAMEECRQESHIVRYVVPQLLNEFLTARLEVKKRIVRKPIATIQEKFHEANSGPVEVFIDISGKQKVSKAETRYEGTPMAGVAGQVGDYYQLPCTGLAWFIHPWRKDAKRHRCSIPTGCLPSCLFSIQCQLRVLLASHSGCSQQRGKRATTN